MSWFLILIQCLKKNGHVAKGRVRLFRPRKVSSIFDQEQLGIWQAQMHPLGALQDPPGTLFLKLTHLWFQEGARRSQSAIL